MALNRLNQNLGDIDANTSNFANLYVNGFPSGATIIGLKSQPDMVSMVIRADSAQTSDLMQWQNSAGTAVTRVDAAGNIVTSGTITAPTIISSGYQTQNTSASNANKWTKIASVSITSQFGDATLLLDFIGNNSGETDSARGRLFVRVKQQNPLGTAPVTPVVTLYNSGYIVSADFALILTQNDTVSTTYELYVKDTKAYNSINFNPIMTRGTHSWLFYSAQAFLTALPTNLGVTNASYPTIFAEAVNSSGPITGTVLSTSNYYRIVSPAGAERISGSGDETGAIAITLPVGWTNTMLRMTVKIFEYASGESFEVVIAGYNYAPTSSWANNPTAYIVGNPNIDRNFTVRFGYTAGGKCVVYIGELTSVWSISQVFVTDVQLGYSGFSSAWATGWSIGLQASAFENVTATITTTQVGLGYTTNTANTLVKRGASGEISVGAITSSGAITGDTVTSTNLLTAGSISSGAITSSSGSVTVDGGGGILKLKPGTNDHVYMEMYADTAAPSTRSAYLGFGAAGTADMTIANQMTNGNINFTTNGTGIVNIAGSKAWHAGNDGASSGLDADLLDGLQGSAYSPVAGSSSIVTVGTVTAGTWRGSDLEIAYGGTGASTGAGLVPVVPTSLTTVSGTASADANGLVTMSGVSSVALNGVFTSAYRNYRVITQVGNTSATGNLFLTPRIGSADISSTVYYQATLVYLGGSTGVSWSQLVNFFHITGFSAASTTPPYAGFTGDILSPQLSTARTILVGQGLGITSSSYETRNFGGWDDTARSCDGLRIWSQGGQTFSGTIKIYGYR